MASTHADKRMTSKGNIDNGSTTRQTQNYEKTLTVAVEIMGEEKITMMELLRGIKEVCGLVCGCRFKAENRYEVTLSSVRGKEKLIDGFKIRNCRIMAKDLSLDEMVVSFLNLPVYITDEVILERLRAWGVSAVSPVKRRFWPGTEVADGTRFCKVKFTDTVRSLPYSTKFETLEGTEYFRVIHDRQVKVCRLCIQPGHVLRDCPDFACHKCGEQGHYARECNGRRERGCVGCGRSVRQCSCTQGDGAPGLSNQVISGDGVEESEVEESGEEMRMGEESQRRMEDEEDQRQSEDEEEKGPCPVGKEVSKGKDISSSLDGVELEGVPGGEEGVAGCTGEATGEALASDSGGAVENPKVSVVPGGSSQEMAPARDDSYKRKGSGEEMTGEEMEFIQSERRDNKKNLIAKKKKRVKDLS